MTSFFGLKRFIFIFCLSFCLHCIAVKNELNKSVLDVCLTVFDFSLSDNSIKRKATDSRTKPQKGQRQKN